MDKEGKNVDSSIIFLLLVFCFILIINITVYLHMRNGLEDIYNIQIDDYNELQKQTSKLEGFKKECIEYGNVTSYTVKINNPVYVLLMSTDGSYVIETKGIPNIDIIGDNKEECIKWMLVKEE